MEKEVMSVGTAVKTKRYSLVMPEELSDELQRLADERGSTVAELLRRFVKLGILAAKVERAPDGALLIREGERERELVLI